MSPGRRSRCGISTSLEIFGDKWTLLIVRDLVFRAKNTFKDFLASDEGIATNILANRLARLEAEGIVAKTKHPESGAMNLYRLTPKGIDLMPMLFEMVLWADTYLTISSKGRELAKKIRADREGVANELRRRLSPVGPSGGSTCNS